MTVGIAPMARAPKGYAAADFCRLGPASVPSHPQSLMDERTARQRVSISLYQTDAMGRLFGIGGYMAA